MSPIYDRDNPEILLYPGKGLQREHERLDRNLAALRYRIGSLQQLADDMAEMNRK